MVHGGRGHRPTEIFVRCCPPRPTDRPTKYGRPSARVATAAYVASWDGVLTPLVAQAEVQRSELRARLLAATAAVTREKPDALSAVEEERLLRHAFTRGQALDRYDLQCLYRMAGVTTFAVRDPGNGERLFGIRMEVFYKRAFEAPHYLILSRTAKGLSVLRHTIPSFIPLDHLLLNANPSRFVRRLRRDLLLHAARKRRIASWRRVDGISLVETDDKAELVKLTLQSGSGRVGYIVMGAEGIDNFIALDGSGKRTREAERAYRRLL